MPPNWFATASTSTGCPVVDGSGVTLVIVVVEGSAIPVADEEIVAEYDPPTTRSWRSSRRASTALL